MRIVQIYPEFRIFYLPDVFFLLLDMVTVTLVVYKFYEKKFPDFFVRPLSSMI